MARNEQTKPSTWAAKVRVSDSSMRCTLEHLMRKPAGSTLQIPHDMQMADVDIWKRSMIGFFVSYKLPFHAVQSIANRIWKTHGLEKTTVMANGFMVFRFNTEAAVGEILARGPWLFGGKAILLQQWQPGFLFDKNKIKTIPVWARLQGLPFPLWNKKGLSLAASMVGKPIACDEATMQCSRLEFARVCIEIDAEEPIIHQFQVVSSLSEKPVSVHVSYEWKPARCATCKVFGHSCKTTGKQQVSLEKDLTVEAAKSPGQDQPRVTSNNAVPEKEAPTLELTHTIVHGKAVPRATTVKLTDIQTNQTSGVQVGNPGNENTHGVQVDQEDRLSQRKENKMDSMTSGAMGSFQDNPRDNGKGKEIEASDSSVSGKPPEGHDDGASSSSPKKKKKKGGKKKRETSGLRQ
ncbi:hypothetical protein OIU78_029485 [Salix suchowensis]|nr:hypothetical protein OIU78_029485 [Salix suchowensis]